MGGLLGAGKREDWLALRSDLETHTDQWLNLAVKCLSLIQSRPDCVNVIVTQTQVSPSPNQGFPLKSSLQTEIKMTETEKDN